MFLDMKTHLYVCTLAETGNFQEAAKRLFISQPNLSMYIKKLENDTGTKLFLRTQHGVTLTQEGKILVSACKEMMSIEHRMEQDISLSKRGKKGKIRIGAFLSLYPFYIPRLIASFHEICPEIELEISDGHLAELDAKLRNDQLDLIICSRFNQKSEFETIPIRKNHLLVVVPATSHSLGEIKTIPGMPFPYLDLETLKHTTFILQERYQQIRQLEDLAFRYHHLEPEHTYTMSSIEAAVQLSSYGFGTSFVMESYVKAIRTEQPVYYFLTGDTDRYGELCINYQKDRIYGEHFDQLLNLIREIYQ
ncbi:MAG: LysR family transcriptional regulator [Bacillota bacterium]|nr:LysR family transcriptional regulator [Bacillota bacterium]